MQKHFAPVVPAPVHLSVEEQAILDDEIAEVQSEITADRQAVNRLMDTNEIIGELKETADAVPELGPIEEQLVAAATDMAVAGTDANPEELIEATPAKGVSTEGFWSTLGDKLKEIWAKIMEMILKAWDAIKRFFGMSGQKVEAAEANLEKTKEAVKQTASTHVHEEPQAAAEPIKPKAKPPFVFAGLTGDLSIGNQFVAPERLASEMQHLIDAIKKACDAIKSNWNSVYDNVKTTADASAIVIKKADEHTYGAFLKIQADGGQSHKEIMKKIATQGGLQLEASAKPLLGEFSLLYTEKNSHSKQWNDISIWASRDNSSDHRPSGTIAAVPPESVDAILKACDGCLGQARAIGVSEDIEKIVRSHKETAEAAMKHLVEVKPSDQAIVDEQDAVKSVSMGIISGSIRQMGWAVYKATDLAFTMGRCSAILTNVSNTVGHYVRDSAKYHA